MAEAPQISVEALPASARHRRIAVAAVALLTLALCVTAPFAHVPLPRLQGFIPIIQGITFVADLITGVLLFGLFSFHRSRAVLILAGGYVLMAAMIVAHTLAFPGALGPEAVIGGVQTAGWLYTVSRFCFPAAVIWYALSNKKKLLVQGPPVEAIGWVLASVLTGTIALVVALTLTDNGLPKLFIADGTFSRFVFYTGLFDTTVAFVALALLLLDRRSVMSELLIISTAAIAAEGLVVTLLSGGRFDLAWYMIRLFSLVYSTSVLVVLLVESARVYEKLWDAFVRLQHENENKLLNLEALAGVFSHELKQPLTSIMLESETALLHLSRPKAELEFVEESLAAILDGSRQANHVLEAIRSFFKPELDAVAPLDLQQIAQEALSLLKQELNEHLIIVRAEFASRTPVVEGHRGQILQVLINLIHNAVEAMASIPVGDRVLTLRTECSGAHDAAVVITDTGPGISPELMSSMFDPFVTSKPSGTGLGLALSRTIAQRHFGDILVSSSAGGGAQFRLVLPGRVEQLTSSAA
jgi:signal transduction histidine kinase